MEFRKDDLIRSIDKENGDVIIKVMFGDKNSYKLKRIQPHHDKSEEIGFESDYIDHRYKKVPLWFLEERIILEIKKDAE